jgi:RNA polymerase sigma factor (sigma-70 family)
MLVPIEDILRLKAGDHEVFKKIYNQWSRKVYFYYLKKTSNDEVSRELSQQVFIKLWRYRDAVSTEYTLDQQLFQKARLIYIDWLRAEATQRKHFAGATHIEEEAVTISPVSDIEMQQSIEESLKHLSPKRRKVFELKHIHGYSYKEIAEVLGITVSTVDNHLLKAASQLRKVFNL